MSEDFERTKILIMVKTYPHPSENYLELVCTAGLTEQGEWVRLYPIDYRYLPPDKQFQKYQWIEVELSERGKGNDKRKESRKPNLESIRILSDPLSTRNQWADRRALVDPLQHYTVNQLHVLHDRDNVSLGIVRPTKVLDLKIESVDPNWKPRWQALFKQPRLFGGQPKPLRKLPYKFSYVFECEDSDKPHTKMIEDWELGTLFLKEAERLGSDEDAAESVRRKFLRDICASTRDTRFFMGTRFPYNTWLVLGLFWPPKTAQKTLF